MFRLNSKLIALVAALLLLPSAALASEPFVIESYSVNISVDKARVHRVREDIDLRFTYQSHGLMREIPLSSSQEPYKIENVAASDPFTLESGQNVLGVRLGDPNQYVHGPKSYALTYDMVYAKDGDSESDIVYVTPIGTEWDTTIQNAEVTITLPTDQIESVAVYRGKYGSNTDVGGAVISGNMVRLSAERLNNNEGLTLYIRLPEGTFTDAPKSLAPAQDVLVLGLILLAAIMAVLTFFRWAKIGRDTEIVPTVEFYAPDDMNPAELEYIVKGSVSPLAISALIFFWASKGYIKYTETKDGGFELERLSFISSDRPSYERAAFEALFAAGSDGTVTNKQIEEKYYEAAQTAIINVEESFRGKRALEDGHGRRVSRIFLLLSLVSPMLYGLLGFVNEPSDTGLFAFVGLVPPIIAYVLGLRLIQRRSGSGFGRAARAILVAAAAAGTCFIASGLMQVRFFGNVLRCLCITALASLAAVLAALINRRTDYATQLLGRCTGFRNFLRAAEKERIEALIDENPSYFFDTLPFAVVLDVTDAWAKKFEGLIKEPPGWYVSHDGYPFSPYIMTRTAMSAATSLSKVYAQRAVKNSNNGSFGGGGFSGGGFSGGGGGGGGGHAW